MVEMCKSRGVSVYTWLLLLARKDLESWEKQTVQNICKRHKEVSP